MRQPGAFGLLLASTAGALLAALVFAPAHWISAGVLNMSGGGIILAQPQGRIWDGSAQLMLHDTASQAPALALPGRLQWHIQPKWLGADITLRSTCCSSADAVLQWRWSGSSMSLITNSVQLQWPAGVLAGLGAPLNTLQLKGQVTMNLTALGLNLLRQNGQWAMSSYAGRLQLGLQQMQSSLSTLPKLGDYLITLSPDASGKSMTLNLQTQEGPLRLEGQGQWQGGRLQFGGYASADAGHEAVLANLLNLLGQREGPRSRLKWG